MPSTSWRSMAMICGSCRYPCAKPIWRGYERAGRTASPSRRSNLARSARTCSAPYAFTIFRANKAAITAMAMIAITLLTRRLMIGRFSIHPH
jgi:hypothetical protein